MTTVAVGHFDLVDPTPADRAIVEGALAKLRKDVRDALPRLLGPRHRVEFLEHFTVGVHYSASLGFEPEGMYAKRGLIQLRRLFKRPRSAGLKAYHMQVNFLHEASHGFLLDASQKGDVIALFGGTSWRDGPYWERVYEAAFDYFVRAATESRLVSRFEDRRRDLADDKLDDLYAIVMRPPAQPPEPEPEPVPEPEPPPEVLALRTQLVAAQKALADSEVQRQAAEVELSAAGGRLAAKDTKLREGLAI